jgi:hypothetical protein
MFCLAIPIGCTAYQPKIVVNESGPANQASTGTYATFANRYNLFATAGSG